MVSYTENNLISLFPKKLINSAKLFLSSIFISEILILFIRDKVFIEFSDKGAIYVYNQKHRIVRSVRERNKVSSIDYLKSPEFDMLVEHYGEVDFVYDESSYYEYRTIDLTTFNDEGKMFHIGYWDERLHAWIQNKLGIDYKKPKDYSIKLLKEEIDALRKYVNTTKATSFEYKGLSFIWKKTPKKYIIKCNYFDNLEITFTISKILKFSIESPEANKFICFGDHFNDVI